MWLWKIAISQHNTIWFSSKHHNHIFKVHNEKITISQFSHQHIFFETILQRWVTPKIWQIQTQPYSYQIHILACQVEIRRRNGVYEQVSMQCKTRHSCENNKAQNFHQKPQQIPGESKSNSLLVYAWYQCQPMPLGQNKDSVCRQCCQTDKEHIQILLK